MLVYLVMLYLFDFVWREVLMTSITKPPYVLYEGKLEVGEIGKYKAICQFYLPIISFIFICSYTCSPFANILRRQNSAVYGIWLVR